MSSLRQGVDLKETNTITSASEQAYVESLREPLEEAERIGEADIVVGIPFRNEVDTVGHVCEAVAQGLSQFFPDKRHVIVCSGDPEGEDALKAIQGVPLGQGI